MDDAARDTPMRPELQSNDTGSDTASAEPPATDHGGEAGTGYRPSFEPGFLHPRYWMTWVLLGIQLACVHLPRRASMAVGAGLGRLFLAINAKRRRIARINLALCFPELDDGQREQLLRAHFRVFGQTVIDLGLIWWGSEQRLARHIRIEGLDTLQRLQAEGRSAIVLTGHQLTADVGGIYASRFVPGIVMVKEIRNPVVNWFVCRGRRRFGSRLILRRHGLRPLVRAMRNGRHCYYVADEDFGPERSVFVPFFGMPTATIPTLSPLVRLSNAAVVPCFTRLDPRTGVYQVRFGAAERDFPGDDPVAGARRMNELIEEAVRAAPEQYMWTFRWFRTRPGGAPSPYA